MSAFLIRFCRVQFVAGVVSLIAASGALLSTGQSLAGSVPAYALVNLNQRAGPDTRFPAIVVAPARSPVSLFGCLRDLSWCDGDFQGHRGWFSARYLQLWYQGHYLPVADYVRYGYLPIVSFNIGSYWASYYSDRPFYPQLSRYAAGGAVAVTIGSFYRPLSQHGSWVLIRERYVWVPRVSTDWRPYTDGRWAYTRTQGWVWASNEPFGWATYHYGRWAYSPTIGWFWVPGTRWAPAWVAWRQSDEYLAWAPLPPDPKDTYGTSVSISFGKIPNYYWQAVPARDFQAPNLALVVIGDNNQVTNIVNQTQSIGNVTIVNNVAVNSVLDVNFVEEKTQQKVPTYKVALTPDANKSGRVEGDMIEVFHPTATDLPPAEKPAEVAPLEKVTKESKTAGRSGNERTTEDLVPPPPPPNETPPLMEAPSMVGAEMKALPSAPEEPAAQSVEQAIPVPPAVVLEGPVPCTEGNVRQKDGSCAAPSASPPLAEEVTPQAPAAESPPALPPTPAATVAPPPTDGPASPLPPAPRVKAQPAPPPSALPMEKTPAEARPEPLRKPGPRVQKEAPLPPSVVPAEGAAPALLPAPTAAEVAPAPAPPADSLRPAQPSPSAPDVEQAPPAAVRTPTRPLLPAELGPAPLPSSFEHQPPCEEGYLVNKKGVCVLSEKK